MVGTAPTEPNWLFVEAPGPWGRDAATALGSLRPSLPPGWRLVMVRRPDRPLRKQVDRQVWSSTPDGVQHWRLPVGDPVLPDGPGEPMQHDVLFLCTNGGRDRCCALVGRRLVDALGSDRVWECSHLGGHRFAPTGVRLSDRMVFGRLDADTARRALAGDTPLGTVRGPSGWAPAVQAAALAVWRHRSAVPIASADVEDGLVRLRLRDGTVHEVRIAESPVPPRPLSCGAAAEPGVALRALS